MRRAPNILRPQHQHLQMQRTSMDLRKRLEGKQKADIWNSAFFLWSSGGKVKKGNVHLEIDNQMKTDLITHLGRVSLL